LGEIGKILETGWFNMEEGVDSLEITEYLAVAYFVNYFEEYRLNYNGRVKYKD
jgi:hypothetical protein